MTRKEQVVLLALAGAISVGSLMLYFHRDAADSPEVVSPARASEAKSKPATQPTAPATAEKPISPIAPTPLAPAAPLRTTVSVVGAVKTPGVYTLDADARIQDLLDEAGGAEETADVSDINFAAKLIDGTTLSVPSKPVWDAKTRQFVQTDPYSAAYNPPQYTRSGWAKVQASGGASGGSIQPVTGEADGRGPIDLNTATQEQLESLPGIGSKLAQQIIAYRTKTPFRSVDDIEKVPGIGARKVEQIRSLVTAH